LEEAKPFLDLLEPFRATRDVYHPLKWGSDRFDLRLPHAESLLRLTILNVARAAIAVEEGKEKEVVESFLAIHHSLSWLHREPIRTSQLTRVILFAIEFEFLERILAQGEYSPETLEDLARRIEAETRIDPARLGMGMEMGAWDRMIEAILDGRVDLERLVYEREDLRTGIAEFWLYRYYGRRNRANMLRELIAMRELFEKNPPPAEVSRFATELAARIRRKKAEGDSTYVFTSLLIPGVKGFYEAKVRFDALGRLAVAALAVERYRLDHKKWPKRWEDLTPKYLASIPADPWDDKPLKLKRVEKGILIYAVGPDGEDDGGRLERTHRFGPPDRHRLRTLRPETTDASPHLRSRSIPTRKSERALPSQAIHRFRLLVR